MLKTTSYEFDSSAHTADTEGVYHISLGYEQVGVCKIGVAAYTIPYSWYNVESTTNVIAFTEEKTDKTATLTVGNYDITYLTQQIAAKLTTASGGVNTYTCTYNDSTMKLTIASDTKNFYLDESKTTAKKIIGLTADTTDAKTATMQEIVDLAPIKTLGIRTNLSLSTDATSKYSNLLMPVTFGGYSAGDLISCTQSDSLLQDSINNKISEFTIYLADQEGYWVDLNNKPWQCFLQLYYR
jgi:hypothetical protein